MRALLLLLFASTLQGQSSNTPRFFPQGYAKHVSQARVSFANPMAAVGSTASPFEIRCSRPGEGRWLSETEWAYDFGDELAAGESCEFTLTQLKDSAGASLQPASFRFHTGGPQVLDVEPMASEYSEIDEEQLFVLTLDAPVRQETLKDRLFFEIPQISNPVAAKILTIDDVKKANPEYARELDERKKILLLVQADARFPTGRPIRMIWDSGIESANGVPAEDRQIFTFKTRPPFAATVHCTRAHESAACSPLDDIHIQFSAEPVKPEAVSWTGLPRGKTIEKLGTSWRIPPPHMQGGQYAATFGDDFKDDADRKIGTKGPLLIKVGQLPPLAKFQSDFGIIERDGKPEVAVHTRGLEKELGVRIFKIPQTPADLTAWIKKQREGQPEKALLSESAAGVQVQKLPPLKGPLEVRGVPLPGPGFYQLEIESPLLGQSLAKKTYNARSQMLVTDLAIHWKQAGADGLVWVTSFATGKPVADAEIKVWDCQLKSWATLKTQADGTARVSKESAMLAACHKNWPDWDRAGLLITAQKADDFSFVFNTSDEGIENWRFGVSGSSRYDRRQIHAVLDRTLLRAGEKVSALIVARDRVKSGLAIPTPSKLKTSIMLQHVGSGKSYTQKISWDTGGRARWSWSIPSDAPLGHYDMSIEDRSVGSFYVREFKVATVKASLSTTLKELVSVRKLPLNFQVQYLNGGSAADLPVSLRGEWTQAYGLELDDYPGFHFGMNPRSESEAPQSLGPMSARLDAAGQGQLNFDLPEAAGPQNLSVELEFPDTNGQLRTQALPLTVWPASRRVGLKLAESWTRIQKPVEADVLLIDQNLKPITGDVILEARKREVFSHRRRSIGGTYTYEHKESLGEVRRLCEIKVDVKGRGRCSLKFAEAGDFQIEARSVDGEGRTARSQLDLNVSGGDRWFPAEPQDRIDLVADKPLYEVGEIAKIMVKAPFPEGMMLVTVEREGILKQEVRPFSSASPFIEVPIARGYAPNIYVSAWVVRGRAKGTLPFLQIDSRKPAYKLGIVDLKVGRKGHTLAVTLKTPVKEYKPRDRVPLDIEIKGPDGKPLDGAVSVAAVDEGLLEIEDNRSWNLLDAMMGHRGYGTRNASDAMFVVGKRHMGMKASADGGGGGAMGSTRELFDTLLYWNPLVEVKAGKARVEIPLNDSLSGFRLVAVAQAGPDLFGRGETQIVSRKDISLLEGFPPLVREGDTFEARMTVRNTSASSQKIRVSGTATNGLNLAEKAVSLAAGQSELVSWSLKVPAGVTELVYQLKAKAESGDEDAVRVKQTVESTLRPQTLQAQLRQIKAQDTITFEKPTNASKARILLSQRTSLSAAAREGIEAYMKTYPYSCIEQKLSRAVALGSRELWNQSGVAGHLDERGLLRFFPIGNEGSVELSAYALELAKGQAWPLPEQDRVLDALSTFVAGHYTPSQRRDVMRDKIRALRTLALYGRDPLEALEALDLQPQYLDLGSLVDLATLSKLYPAYSKAAEIPQALAMRAELRGSVLQLKESRFAMLGSPDATGFRLLALRVEQKDPEAPRLLEGLLARQKKGHWDTTVADALGAQTLRHFAEAYESKATPAPLRARLGAQQLSLVSGQEAQAVAWPEGQSQLQLEGDGWLLMRAEAAVPLTSPESAGLKLERSMKVVRGESKAKIGDIYEVELKVRTQTEQGWTALFDPLPPGARALPGERNAAYVEEKFSGLMIYFERLPPGEHTFKYRFQLNTRGEFQLPPAQVEALYAPEVYARLPGLRWSVE